MSPAGLRTHYEIPKSAMRNNYFAKAKISEIEEKNILPCIFKKNISIQYIYIYIIIIYLAVAKYVNLVMTSTF